MLYLLKTRYGILQVLYFDWFIGNGMWAHLPWTTNMLVVRVFFAMIVPEFEDFLRVFLIKQLFPAFALVGYEVVISQLGAAIYHFISNARSWNNCLYILLTKPEGRSGRISARGLDSTDRAQQKKKKN